MSGDLMFVEAAFLAGFELRDDSSNCALVSETASPARLARGRVLKLKKSK